MPAGSISVNVMTELVSIRHEVNISPEITGRVFRLQCGS